MESNTFFLQINQSLGNLRDKLSNWIDEIVLMIPNLVLALAIMVVTFLLMGFISRLLRKTLKRVMNSKAMINLLTNIGSVFFVLAALVIVLAVLNLDQALFSLLAGAGVAGLAVGLALQDPLAFDANKNFMMARSQSVIAIKKAFDKAGIDIPFPIRTLDFGEQSIHLAQAEQIKIIPSEISSN